jgi:hypothetical protein
MKIIALLICLMLFAGCAEKNEIEYTIGIADRLSPKFENLKLSEGYDFHSALSAFWDHAGSAVDITLSGKSVARYDGSAPVVISTNGGNLEISGKTNSDIFVYILTGDPKNFYTVWFKSYFRKGEIVHYSLDLPKDFSKIRTTE